MLPSWDIELATVTPTTCGGRNCRGVIVSDFFSLDDDHQRLYLSYAPDLIKREHRRRTASAALSVP